MRAPSLFACDLGLLDALPHQFGGSADGCGGNGVFELVSGNYERTFLRSAVPIGVGAGFDVEDDGLVLHFVFAEVGDAARDDGLVFLRAALVAVVRGKFRQAGAHDGDRVAAVRGEDEQASRIGPEGIGFIARCVSDYGGYRGPRSDKAPRSPSRGVTRGRWQANRKKPRRKYGNEA